MLAAAISRSIILAWKNRLCAYFVAFDANSSDPVTAATAKAHPGIRQHFAQHERQRAIAGCNADQAQVDDRDGSDHQHDGEHVKRFDPGKQDVVFPHGDRNGNALKPIKETVYFHAAQPG